MLMKQWQERTLLLEKKGETDYIQLAKKTGEQIKEKENRDLLHSDLETIPGYKKE